MGSILRRLIPFAIVVSIAASFAFQWSEAHDNDGAAVAMQGISEVAAADLPREAREILRRIRQGGPFADVRDGVTFSNFEKLLPLRGRRYYREYTVTTPGISGRGARRIIVGRNGEMYYTADHYVSFRRILE